MKPVCTSCGLFYRPKKNGFVFEEGMPHSEPIRWTGTNPGETEPKAWAPYKLWRGDLYECRGCGNQVVVGVAQAPLAEHYYLDYESTREAFGGDSIPFIHDC